LAIQVKKEQRTPRRGPAERIEHGSKLFNTMGVSKSMGQQKQITGLRSHRTDTNTKMRIGSTKDQKKSGRWKKHLQAYAKPKPNTCRKEGDDEVERKTGRRTHQGERH